MISLEMHGHDEAEFNMWLGDESIAPHLSNLPVELLKAGLRRRSDSQFSLSLSHPNPEFDIALGVQFASLCVLEKSAVYNTAQDLKRQFEAYYSAAEKSWIL